MSSQDAASSAELEEDELDDEEELYVLEGKEKKIYVIDGRPTETLVEVETSSGEIEEVSPFAASVQYAIEHLKRLIRSKSPDMIGVTVFGDSGSRRGAPVLALGKATALGVKRLREMLDASDLGSFIVGNVEADKIVESRESCIRNGLWSAQAQLENKRDPKKQPSAKSIVVFGSAFDLDDGDDHGPCLRLASDCRDQDVEIQVAVFGEKLSFWQALVAANHHQSEEDVNDTVIGVFNAADTVRHPQQQQENNLLEARIKKPRPKGAFALTFLGLKTTTETTAFLRVKKFGYLQNIPRPQTSNVVAKTGQPVRSVTRCQDPYWKAPVGPAEMRRYCQIGVSDGRAYANEEDVKRCGDVRLRSDDIQDGETVIVGFLDIETFFRDYRPGREPTTVLVPDEGTGPASTDVFAAIVGAMQSRKRVALALESVRYQGSNKTHRNPSLIALEPVISTGPPLPTGLLVHVLPFLDEIVLRDDLRDSIGLRQKKRPRETTEEVANEKVDALDSAMLDVVRGLRRDDVDPLKIPNPVVAKLWAAIECLALNEDDAVLEAAKARSRDLGRPPIPLVTAINALNDLAGTQDDVDQASKKPKLDTSFVPPDLLTPAVYNDIGHDAWIAQLRPYTKAALITAAQTNLPDLRVKISMKKDPLLEAIASYLGSGGGFVVQVE